MIFSYHVKHNHTKSEIETVTALIERHLFTTGNIVIVFKSNQGTSWLSTIWQKLSAIF